MEEVTMTPVLLPVLPLVLLVLLPVLVLLQLRLQTRTLTRTLQAARRNGFMAQQVQETLHCLQGSPPAVVHSASHPGLSPALLRRRGSRRRRPARLGRAARSPRRPPSPKSPKARRWPPPLPHR